MLDRREARNGGTFSLFVTELECDDFIAAQAVPGDWTKTFISVEAPPTPPTYTYIEGQQAQTITDVVNDGAFETDLAIYTTPPEMLWFDGDAVFLEAFGQFFANVNGKRLRVYVGTTLVYDSTNQVQSGGKWSVKLGVYKLSETEQKVIVQVSYSSDVLLFTSDLITMETTEDMVVDLPLIVTGEGIDADDVVCTLSVAKYIKAV